MRDVRTARAPALAECIPDSMVGASPGVDPPSERGAMVAWRFRSDRPKGFNVAMLLDDHDAHAMTQAGYERLSDELRVLSTVRRKEIADDLRDAREDGVDLADNASLADVIEEQQRLQRRIDELEGLLARARVVAPPRDGVAGIGTRVRVRRPGAKPIEYELVGALEADARNKRVSIASPVGQALLGRAVGDVVEVDAPGGSTRLEILAIDELTSAGTAPER